MTHLAEQEYTAIAHAALAHFPLDVTQLEFIQYSGGITFRIEATRMETSSIEAAQEPTSFLLKIHMTFSQWVDVSPEVVRARHTWLSELGQATGLEVQMPIPNRQGDLLTLVSDATREAPYSCTLQKWIEGTAGSGHLTPAQIRQIGAMMAQFHQFSSGWSALSAVANDLPVHRGMNMAEHVQTLALAVELGFLTDEDYALIQAAAQIVVKFVEAMGRDPQRWGPCHSDFHHGNLIYRQDDIYLIDFDCLSLSPYACDIGLMLYHIYYQGPTIYPALIEGYETVRPLPVDTKNALDIFVAQAAISNLAFNVTIPEQYTQPYLPRNLRELVDDFCRNLVAGKPFLFA